MRYDFQKRKKKSYGTVTSGGTGGDSMEEEIEGIFYGPKWMAGEGRKKS